MTRSLDFLECLIQMSYSQWTTRERWSIGQIGVGRGGTVRRRESGACLDHMGTTHSCTVNTCMMYIFREMAPRQIAFYI